MMMMTEEMRTRPSRHRANAPITRNAPADQHDRVEDRGVHVHRHALHEGLGQERTRKRDEADQQREGEDLRRDGAATPNTLTRTITDRDRDRRIGERPPPRPRGRPP